MWHQRYWLSCALWIISSTILAPIQYACYSPLDLLISTFITTLWPSYSTSIFYIGTSLLIPLFSTLVLFFHPFLPRFSPLSFTPIHSNPTWSFHSALYSQLWFLNSVSSIISPLYTSLLNRIGSDCIGSYWISSVWISSLCSALTFAPLDLIIYLIVTYHKFPYQIFLGCIIK